MSVLKRSVVYFEKPGFSNTDSVIEVVKERLRLGDVKVVVVPVTTGRTAERFSRELGKKAEVITITEDEVTSACKRIAYSDKGNLKKLVQNRLEGALKTDSRRRREVFDMTLLPFCGDMWDVIKEILYAFGQGMKVAVEVSVVAVEILKVKPFSKIVAVGGTGEGADTAIVARTSSQKEAFGKKPEKRLSIQEIIAMPIEKW